MWQVWCRGAGIVHGTMRLFCGRKTRRVWTAVRLVAEGIEAETTKDAFDAAPHAGAGAMLVQWLEGCWGTQRRARTVGYLSAAGRDEWIAALFRAGYGGTPERAWIADVPEIGIMGRWAGQEGERVLVRRRGVGGMKCLVGCHGKSGRTRMERPRRSKEGGGGQDSTCMGSTGCRGDLESGDGRWRGHGGVPKAELSLFSCGGTRTSKVLVVPTFAHALGPTERGPALLKSLNGSNTEIRGGKREVGRSPFARR